MPTPFFSIITCTYNSSKYLEQNLESVKLQTFTDYEQIFVDGLSSDDTLEILKNYKTSGTSSKIVDSEPRGIANAMNIGINKAHGKYLLFLNSDDYLFNNQVLEKAYRLMKDEKYSWYYGIIDTVSENGDKLFTHPRKRQQRIFWYWIFSLSFFMQHQAIFYSRELFNKYGLYDETLNSMDYDYAMRIGKKEKAGFINVMVSSFRLGGFSTKNKKIMEKNVRAVFKKHFFLDSFWFFLRGVYIKLFIKDNLV